MTGKDIVKFFISCVIVAAIVGGGYVAYRYYSTPRSLNLGSVGTMSALSKLPAMRCAVATGGFDASYQGIVYIDSGELRADIIYEQGSVPTLIHTIVATSGVAYRWNEGSTQGIKVPFDFSASALQMNCLPWWRPDTTIFALPLGVTFTQAPASQ